MLVCIPKNRDVENLILSCSTSFKQKARTINSIWMFHGTFDTSAFFIFKTSVIFIRYYCSMVQKDNSDDLYCS